MAQFLARLFSCHILTQFLGMPHQTGLKCDLKNFSAYKQVKPRFTTTSRIIISIRNTNKNLINSEISEISEKNQRVAKLSEYVKMFNKSLKLTQLKQIK